MVGVGNGTSVGVGESVGTGVGESVAVATGVALACEVPLVRETSMKLATMIATTATAGSTIARALCPVQMRLIT